MICKNWWCLGQFLHESSGDIEKKKDILTYSKTKFGPWDNWLHQWDTYPIIEDKNTNINKRGLVWYKKILWGVTCSIQKRLCAKTIVYFHPSLSKRSGGLKCFDVSVPYGLDVNGIPTIAFRRGNSCFLIFLIDSTWQVTSKPGTRGCLVAFWFSASGRERLIGAGVSMVIVPLIPKTIQWVRVGEY